MSGVRGLLSRVRLLAAEFDGDCKGCVRNDLRCVFCLNGAGASACYCPDDFYPEVCESPDVLLLESPVDCIFKSADGTIYFSVIMLVVLLGCIGCMCYCVKCGGIEKMIDYQVATTTSLAHTLATTTEEPQRTKLPKRVKFVPYPMHVDPLNNEWRITADDDKDAMIEKRFQYDKNRKFKDTTQIGLPPLPPLEVLRERYGEQTTNEELYHRFKFYCDYIGFNVHSKVRISDLREISSIPDGATLQVAPVEELRKLSKLPRNSEFRDKLVPLDLKLTGSLINKNKSEQFKEVVFVSHKWRGSDPDPGGLILSQLPDCTYVWIDYVCTDQDKCDFGEIANAIKAIPHIEFWQPDYKAAGMKDLDDGYNMSAWCQLELHMQKLEPFVNKARRMLCPYDWLGIPKEKLWQTQFRDIDPRKDIVFGNAASEQIFLKTMITLFETIPMRNQYIEMCQYFHGQTFVVLEN